jgi:calcineurin-like phosphoesterase family protein
MSGRVFFTSDLHIGHNFVAGLRGFSSTDDHDDALALNWDRVVNPNGDRGDQVWVLGDLSVGGDKAQKRALAWMMQRPGRKHLIVGNHDGAHPMNRNAHVWQKHYLGVFESVQMAARRRINGQNVLLSHFPYAESEWADHTAEARYPQWRLPNMGLWLLHGHIHTKDKLHEKDKSIHVGVDAWNLTPIPLEEIEELIPRVEL